MTEPAVVLLMGVAGCGKTAVGRRLAGRLGVGFIDADDLHPPANVARMRRGEPLTEADREPWLDRVAEVVDGRADEGAVLACSALRRAHREQLGFPAPGRALILLDVPAAVLRERLAARAEHFFPADLLDSQLAALEPPPARHRVAADAPLATVVDRVHARLESGSD